MATIGRTRSAGPAAQANVKRVHITLIDATAALDKIRGELVQAEADDRPAPTDIFVVGRQPFHYVDEPRELGGQFLAHPQVHLDFTQTILQLTVERESALWWSETEFHIDERIALADDHPHADLNPPGADPPATPAAVYPFPEPVTSEAIKDDNGHVLFWQARSTEPKASARGHYYKISFIIGGQTVDPDMFCGGG
jgi:hypothetical protein